jgi:ribulose-phosphate 3-epimerase
MPSLIPVILSKSQQDFDQKTLAIYPYSKHIHIDIMDGQFVPNTTIIPEDLPRFSDPIKLSLHMMVKNPFDYLPRLQHPSISTLIFHYESIDNFQKLLDAMPSKYGKGIALNPSTPIKVIEPFLIDLDVILIMGVEAGFSGQEPMANTYDRISEARSLSNKVIIEVDGGVNKDNARKLAESGADRIASGSYIFESENLDKAVKDLKKQIGDFQ